MNICFSLRSRLCLVAMGLLAAPLAQAAGDGPAASLDKIIERNAVAHGGLAAWHGIKTLTLSGEMDAGGKPNRSLPFVLQQRRPGASRLEIQFRDQTAVQVFDGTQGWKLRPYLNRSEVESYTASELATARGDADLEGLLADYASRGIRVAADGTDSVEGHRAYRLVLTLKDGAQRHLWVDASTYLELKLEGAPRVLDGKPHAVYVFYRDYRNDQGLVMAHLQETAVEGVTQTYKLKITKVSVNPSLADTLFQKPQLPAVAVADSAH